MLRHIVREWCNGNTTDFDSVILGSSPSTRAIFPVSSKVEHPADNRETEDRYLYREPNDLYNSAGVLYNK